MTQQESKGIADLLAMTENREALAEAIKANPDILSQLKQERLHNASVEELKAIEKQQRLRADFNKVASSAEGRAVLFFIMDTLCGYHLPAVATDNTGKLDTVITTINAAQRNIWHSIRELITDKRLLQEIEFLIEPDDQKKA